MKPLAMFKLATIAATATAFDEAADAHFEKMISWHEKGILTDSEFADAKKQYLTGVYGKTEVSAPRRVLSEKKDDVAKSKCLASQVASTA